MATTADVLAALADLRADLGSGMWLPDEYERVMAVIVQTEGGAGADAIRAGLRAAGPHVTHGQLAPIAARCAYVLEAPSRAASPEGQAVKAALDEVLGEVVVAGLRR
ncbi:hypothetical protein [Streptomyces sp. KR55]|uniref:hypothetical protein n=1 Tax=Streptomyces sp. KR55 TaxID=3457425 RepID=UPI003FD69A91